MERRKVDGYGMECQTYYVKVFGMELVSLKNNVTSLPSSSLECTVLALTNFG